MNLTVQNQMNTFQQDQLKCEQTATTHLRIWLNDVINQSPFSWAGGDRETLVRTNNPPVFGEKHLLQLF